MPVTPAVISVTPATTIIRFNFGCTQMEIGDLEHAKFSVHDIDIDLTDGQITISNAALIKQHLREGILTLDVLNAEWAEIYEMHDAQLDPISLIFGAFGRPVPAHGPLRGMGGFSM